jgi:hypothetical protein
MLAASRAQRSAISRPIPRDAPVMKIVFPLRVSIEFSCIASDGESFTVHPSLFIEHDRRDRVFDLEANGIVHAVFLVGELSD